MFSFWISLAKIITSSKAEERETTNVKAERQKSPTSLLSVVLTHKVSYAIKVVVAIMDYCGDDAQTSRIVLLMARILNSSAKSIDKIIISDELGVSGKGALKAKD